MTSWNLADLYELVASTVPERLAITSPGANRTYAELDRNADRFASFLIENQVLPDDRVAILSWNRVEWLEAMLGCFKARAVPVNVNYRYVQAELHHILEDSDAVAIVYEDSFSDLVASVLPRLPLVRVGVTIPTDTETGENDIPNSDSPNSSVLNSNVLTSRAWADTLAIGAERDHRAPARSGDDLYMLYTGGTTGTPKGVMWRHEDIFLSSMTSLVEPSGPHVVLEVLAEARAPWLITSPLMHGNGQWNSLRALIAGNGVSLWTEHRFDPAGVIAQTASDQAQLLVLVGDGMSRPFVDALTELRANGSAPDLSSLGVIASGGAILSPTVKAELAELLPGVLVVDGFGASESGGNGVLIGTGDEGAPRFEMKPNTAVLDDDNRPLPPGSGLTGRLASTGHIPLRYHKDPVKTEATFPTIDGVRWAIPGDAARLEADGSITIFGRGSNCINTGGEKVFPEEVEAKLKGNPEVADAFVVGLPDDRFGQRVAAVVVRREGSTAGLDDLRSHLRNHLAGYKLPKEAIFVDALSYTGPGKPDYKWAKAQFTTQS